jgi:putative flippase GtrA
VLNKGLSVKLSKKLFRFIFIGGFTTASYILLVSFFVSAAHVEPRTASVFAYCFSLPLSFVGHRFHTFNSGGIIWHEVSKFIITHLVSLGIVVASMYIVFTVLSYPYWLGSIIGAILVPLLNFLVFNYWVFEIQKRD